MEEKKVYIVLTGRNPKFVSVHDHTLIEAVFSTESGAEHFIEMSDNPDEYFIEEYTIDKNCEYKATARYTLFIFSEGVVTHKDFDDILLLMEYIEPIHCEVYEYASRVKIYDHKRKTCTKLISEINYEEMKRFWRKVPLDYEASWHLDVTDIKDQELFNTKSDR